MMRNYGNTQLGRLAATALGAGGKGFKEAKEKSVKKHEEYRDNVAKALEAKHAPAIANAQLKRAAAEEAAKPKMEAVKVAKSEKEAVEKKAKPAQDEVKRLEKVVADNRKNNTYDPAAIEALKKAQTAVAPIEDKRKPDEKVKVAEASRQILHLLPQKKKNNN